MSYELAKCLVYKKLARRAHHTKEIRDILVKKGIAPDVAFAVIAELTNLGYLNDEEWVEGAVKSLKARKWGPKAIAYKLLQKGIKEEEFSSFLQELDSSQEDVIIQMLKTRYQSKNLSDYKERGKVIASLLRKGYSLSSILSAIQKTPSR